MIPTSTLTTTTTAAATIAVTATTISITPTSTTTTLVMVMVVVVVILAVPAAVRRRGVTMTLMVSALGPRRSTLTVPPVHHQGGSGDHGGLVTQQEQDSVGHIGYTCNRHRTRETMVDHMRVIWVADVFSFIIFDLSPPSFFL